MRKGLPYLALAILVLVATLACVGSAVPTTSPGAVSTIVVQTMEAIARNATPTPAQPTIAPPTPQPAGASQPPTLPASAPTVAVPAATRISFLTDATAGVVSGPIGPGETQTYVLQAFQAQPMLVEVNSLNNDVTISMRTQGGTNMLSASAQQSTWVGTLPQTEDYYLTVHGGATTENFTLTVTIPSRIKFGQGATSAKVTGKTTGGYDVTYTVFAIKDQKMSVDLSNLSGEAALTIYGFTDGQPYVRSATGKTTFSFVLPATQDYIIQVVPQAGSVVSYLMTVKIQ